MVESVTLKIKLTANKQKVMTRFMGDIFTG
jgi:hypothetical protein